MGRMIRKMLIGVAAATVLVACGCAQKPKMSEHRQQARDRWAESRSQMMYGLAVQQFEAGDLDKAERSIAQALSADPEKAPYLELAARLMMERGELEKAFHTLKEATKIDPKHASSHYTLGIVLQRWQRYDAALAEYELAYSHAPDQVSYLLAVAEMLVKLERVDTAQQRLEEKLAYFAANAAIRVAVGRLHMFQHDYAKAVSLLREASLLAPEDPTIVEHLARAELAAGHHDEAAFRITQLLKREDYAERDDLRAILGDCHLAAKRLQDARAVFVDLTRRNPDDVDCWVKLAEVSIMGGDRVRLAESARRILALAPHRYEGYMLRGLMEREAGQVADALASFDRASQLAPQNTQPLILKGMTLEQTGDRRAAAQVYQEALRVSPDDDRARRLLTALVQ